jgi:hypothetical protein
MTVKEMEKLIKSKWLLSDGKGLSFTVRIEDMRENWGKAQCLVSPMDGSGERWVDMTSLSVILAAKA